ncbi:hypothetical protein ABL78_5787 [Leptomonas seymouri]|uniref:Uncharacterized protein n=1 Tax=Leptomonas seymouri TaxID=5684 RepID=A0A0N1PCB3_LEPSE|nr:hypothetical protein ABL78_5787 [Leptomonas seymouri]|eukprot:KPI85162.1 hypothetical protein ABL78_5787 [Leptomonas seymouri]
MISGPFFFLRKSNESNFCRMRCQNKHSKNGQLPSSGPSDGQNLLNGTLSQPSGWHQSGEMYYKRRDIPSVRPLPIHSPAISVNNRSEERYVDPSCKTDFIASGVLPLRRSPGSISSSFRSVVSLAPSSLRYVGFTPARNHLSVERLGYASLPRPQQFPVSQPVHGSSARFKVRTPSTPEESIKSHSVPLHPLLKQALLLTTSSEVEDRLTVCQKEIDGFDDILALFSVAKEVEAVRVAAFDMFELEIESRRTLHAQQKRERHVLWYLFLENYNNAVLSQEVRALQLGDGKLAIKQAGSLLRSRSTSLHQQSHKLFYSKCKRSGSSPPRGSVCSVNVEDVAHASATSAKHQPSYPANRTPRGTSPRMSSEKENANSRASTSSSYSTSTSSSPLRVEPCFSRTIESLDVAGERILPPRREDEVAIESALDSRIARQQLLLASGYVKRSHLAAPLFPRRLSPK